MDTQENVTNMQEVVRLITGLRAAGWADKNINDLLLYVASGDEQYKPKPQGKEEL